MTNQIIPNKNYTFVLYTTLKDAAPYLLDWISYHLSIGFTHFAIATNDCDDGTDNLLRQLEELGVVSRRSNTGPHPQGIQKHGFLRLQDIDAIQNAEWMMQLDIDEYLRIDVGKRELIDLVAAISNQSQAVSFVTQVFGDNGVNELIDAPVISQFQRAAHSLQIVPAQIGALKTFYKNGYFERIGPNRPLSFQEYMGEGHFEWLDADGVLTNSLVKSQKTHAAQNGFAFGTALGRVNRYAIQSLDAFALKWLRGFPQPNHPVNSENLTASEYWLRNNWNIVEETSILKYLDAANAYKEQFMQIEKIKKLHRKGFRIHRQKANQLRRKNKDFFAPFETLQPLKIGQAYPLYKDETPPPKNWMVDLNLLRQKLLVTNLLKYYIDDVNYSPASVEIK